MIYNSNFSIDGHLQASTGEHLMAPAIPWISVFRILMADGDGHESIVPIGGGFNWNKWYVETGGVFFERWYGTLQLVFAPQIYVQVRTSETWKDGEFVCLKLGEISGVVPQPTKTEIPYHVGWSFWGVASPPTSAGTIWASGNARDACVLLGFLGVTKVFHVLLILFLQTPKQMKQQFSI